MKSGGGLQLSDETFEPLILSAKKNIPFDLRDIQFIDPYGMVGLLDAGTFIAKVQFGFHFLLDNSIKV